MDFKSIEMEETYEQLAMERECGMSNVLSRLNNLRREYELKFKKDETTRNLIDKIEYRIKSYDSAIEKIKRKGWPMEPSSLDQMHDIAGIRIIVPYLDDIDELKEIVKKQRSMKVVEERDYINNPKDNGYRSLHLIVKMMVVFSEKTKWVPVEIQFRTRAMDLWASYEHTLKYKNPNPSPDTVQQFSEIAKQLAIFENSLMTLRDFNAEDMIAAESDNK